jgi:hypothetical protein
MKNLFIPLYKEYFLKFKNGEQDCEIRPLDHRGWNTKNVFPGRVMTLANGYGKHDRLKKMIDFTRVTNNLKSSGISKWHTDAMEAIYGKRDKWLIAYV